VTIEVPALGDNPSLALPPTAERTLANGLTIIAIQRSSVPLVELRLRIPFAAADLAGSGVLSRTLFSGTEQMSTVQIAGELQRVGGALSAGADADRLLITGNALVGGLDRVLELLSSTLRGATYPDTEVATERGRLADGISVALTQPSHLARVALLKRMYGSHPYAVQTPSVQEVRAIERAAVVSLHAARIVPTGATLVLCGDFAPEAALDAAEKALGTWAASGQLVTLPPTPDLVPGALTLAHRAESVQSSLRLALPAVARTHPDHAALQLANLIFGGYFSSRWTENIREDKGYTYGPHSSVEHSIAGSALTLSAEVATEVTAPALLETYYELGRLATLAPTAEELEQARQYAIGSLLIGAASQGGLAGMASTYAGFGLRLDFLVEHSARLASATRDEVAAAAAKYLAPARAITVVLGDADKVEQPLAALGPVQRAAAA
jgi:predicted Zn-dependent peptidase